MSNFPINSDQLEYNGRKHYIYCCNKRDKWKYIISDKRDIVL